MIDGFRARHEKRDDLDERALGDMVTPEACLSPAACYHIYHLHQNRSIPAGRTVACRVRQMLPGRRWKTSHLRRLWDFTMREIVFMGMRDDVLREREAGIRKIGVFLDEHQLAEMFGWPSVIRLHRS